LPTCSRHDSLQPLPRSSLLPLSLVLLLLLWQRFSQADHSISRAGLSLFLLSIAGVAGALLALRWQRQIPVFTPLLLAWLYFWLAALLAYLAERQRREQAVQLFSRFLDARVVDNLVRSGDAEQWQASQSRPVTVLFSDIRGFTSLSESAPPEQIVDLLNRYFSRQVAVIFRHGGTLDKFIGDAIMAFWGAPTDDARHAIHAVDAALDMVDELMAFRSELGQAGAHFDVGIGLHSGPAVVGLIGSSQRLDYTAIGDTVNLASRIEGQTKGVARILVSQATRELCSDQFEFTDHGLHHVKGREQGVRLFEPKRRTH
jgi:adenylate cyclase